MSLRTPLPFAFALTLCGAAGAFLGFRLSGAPDPSGLAGLKAGRTRAPAAVDPGAVARAGARSRVDGAEPDPQMAPDATVALRQLGALDRFRTLRRFFPQGDVGETLAVASALMDARDAVGSPDYDLYNQKIQLLEKTPSESLGAIAHSLDHLPSEYTEERQSLVQLGAALEVPLATKTEFLIKETRRPSGGPGSVATSRDAAVALETLMSLHERDARALEPALLGALEAHRNDRNTQRLLVFTYAAVDERRADELKSRFGLE